MRSSEFWDLVDEEFGRAHGRMLVHDLVLLELGNRTAEQAIEAGESLREVWFALCRSMDVPPERQWGKDEKERRRA
ncbi:DUF3046 domain-containing protein [Kineosporia rhizophila]|uniref:DUF3046 domain-containing protein n=1 Tax=Kineosporia TaxID=49184 RepID=UPI001E59AD10|nr:DUF3046 domain-containing protein [Kineosporia sp. NBRC 101677]MCE0540259.1 DUF3046 domain-containing protein [Kineosporia rhizophila]GLY16280.1 hypothetical protein Kisp01_32950 [Kineosporia sp. NBRC 101677]